jgi:anaerobic ribonucleoside-triphosphate reductase activating protein
MSQIAVVSDAVVLQVAQIVPCTEAEGPGRRFALWFQGCPLRCPGCCNPEMLPFHGGRAIPISDVVQQLEATARTNELEGITLLGGEPLAHAAGAVLLARAAHAMGLNVMAFTGYTLEEARTNPDAAVQEVLGEIDILVDGPYIRELPESQRRWIGSSNQRIHFLTDRCRADDPRWQQRNTLEIRLVGNELSVNGFPARSAVGLWKRPPLRSLPLTDAQDV